MLPIRNAPTAIFTERKSPFSEFVRTMLAKDRDARLKISCPSVSTSTVPRRWPTIGSAYVRRNPFTCELPQSNLSSALRSAGSNGACGRVISIDRAAI